MPWRPKGIVEQEELEKFLDGLQFPPEYRLKFREVSDRLSEFINGLDLFRKWDLFPYYNVRSESELAKLKEEHFA
jgi:hypothetical protein